MNQSNIYKRHRFPREIIQYAVWPYHRFNLGHRDIEDLLAERGITVSSNRCIKHNDSWVFMRRFTTCSILVVISCRQKTTGFLERALSRLEKRR